MTLILPNNVANGLLADGDKLDQNFDTITDWANQEAITRDGTTAMTQPLLLPSGMPTQPNQAASKAYVDQGVPLGTVVMSVATAEPINWQFCRGQALSRATYAALFAVMGTTYGAGDGTTTFNLPNYQGSLPVGHNSKVNAPPVVGDAFSSAVGERFGNKDGVTVAHQHGVNIWSSNENANHLHNGNTGTESALHRHGVAGMLHTGSGVTADALGLVGTAGSYPYLASTDTEDTLHTHPFTTGGVSANHQHAINGVSDIAGVTANNMNYPPCQSINFIIKVQ